MNVPRLPAAAHSASGCVDEIKEGDRDHRTRCTGPTMIADGISVPDAVEGFNGWDSKHMRRGQALGAYAPAPAERDPRQHIAAAIADLVVAELRAKYPRQRRLAVELLALLALACWCFLGGCSGACARSSRPYTPA